MRLLFVFGSLLIATITVAQTQKESDVADFVSVDTRQNPRADLYIRMEESRRFRDARMVRIRQLGRTGGAALPIAHEKGRDLRLWRECCRRACPSRVRNACVLR